MNETIYNALKKFVRYWKTYINAWGMDTTRIQKLIAEGNEALKTSVTEEDTKNKELLERFISVCSRALNERLLFKKEIRQLLDEAKELGF